MVPDKQKQEDFENGLIDPKTIELDAKYKRAKDGKKSLDVIFESMNYNFGKIRTQQHVNTKGVHKIAFEQKLLDNKLQEIKIRQGEFRPKVEAHIKLDNERDIKVKAQWGLVYKILGGSGTAIIMVLALLQLINIIGG